MSNSGTVGSAREGRLHFEIEPHFHFARSRCAAAVLVRLGLVGIVSLFIAFSITTSNAQTPVPPTAPNADETWNRVIVLIESGNVKEAKDLLRSSFSAFKDAKEKEEVITHALQAAVSIVALHLDERGNALMNSGLFGAAEPIFQKTFHMRQEAFGDDYTGVAISLNNMGWAYLAQGRYPEAEPLLRRAISIRERLQGKDNIELAAPLNILGSVLAAERRFAEAEVQFLRALKINNDADGNVHDRGVILRNLALLYQDEGRSTEAASMEKEAAALGRRSN